jgi:hypothetical protein
MADDQPWQRLPYDDHPNAGTFSEVAADLSRCLHVSCPCGEQFYFERDDPDVKVCACGRPYRVRRDVWIETLAVRARCLECGEPAHDDPTECMYHYENPDDL